MSNPWEKINIDDYESHMSLDSVKQLQTMNLLMKDQFEAYPVDTAIIFGIAGGNGLEYARAEKYKKVYGVDINADYLAVAFKRYPHLSGVLKCLKLDLMNDVEELPHARIVIANLLVEYIGYDVFQKAVLQVNPEYVSCVIQINADEKHWVSDSPYLHLFDRLEEIHQQMDERQLSETMKEIGYYKILYSSEPLPNAKSLVRVDYKNNR